MTDTTDIKALRAGLTEQLDHMECYGGKGWVNQEDIRSILNSLDQLEAERQRADNASFRENHLNDMLNDKIQQNVDLRAELAAMKGERVPYTYLVEEESRSGFCRKVECHADYPGAVPVYDHPQKPVVLPEGTGWSSDPYNHGRNDGIRECKAAIEAAGGIVKEGD